MLAVDRVAGLEAGDDVGRRSREQYAHRSGERVHALGPPTRADHRSVDSLCGFSLGEDKLAAFSEKLRMWDNVKVMITEGRPGCVARRISSSEHVVSRGLGAGVLAHGLALEHAHL
eukprot:scaffold31367_cov75-Phaeocystis_antarctica.AAC.2